MSLDPLKRPVIRVESRRLGLGETAFSSAATGAAAGATSDVDATAAGVSLEAFEDEKIG